MCVTRPKCLLCFCVEEFLFETLLPETYVWRTDARTRLIYLQIFKEVAL